MQEIYVLLEDNGESETWSYLPIGVAVTTEEEAKIFVSMGIERVFWGWSRTYEKIKICDTQAEAVKHRTR